MYKKRNCQNTKYKSYFRNASNSGKKNMKKNSITNKLKKQTDFALRLGSINLNVIKHKAIAIESAVVIAMMICIYKNSFTSFLISLISQVRYL